MTDISNQSGRISRTRSDVRLHRDPGPYIAEVVSHLDSKMMGSLKVRLLRTMQTPLNSRDEDSNLITAFYASPFYGVTNLAAVGANDDFRESQQSYGMWFVPPDPGAKVLVTMVEGRADICFWFACVPDDYMNFMIPDGRPATTLVTPGLDGNNQTGEKLPVGEYNKLTARPEGGNQPTAYLKPANRDFIATLTQQGLLADDFRGLTSSSARREVPSAVFGVNTPGPLDKRDGARGIRAGTDDHNMDIYSHRLGGHSLVMDDGDANILRRGSPADSPAEYIDVENNPDEVTSDMRVRPANELFRIRTRTGHQILLHNTEDLIYIANSRGTAWIELTSNGKIDIYAQDSISMHTEGEFNFTADSNVNITAGEDVNINATGDVRLTSGVNTDVKAGGRIALGASDSISGEAGDFISFRSSSDLVLTSASANVNITGAQNIEQHAYSDINLISSGSTRVSADTNFEVNAGVSVKQNSPEINNTSDTHNVDTSVMNLLAGNNVYLTGGAGIDVFTAALKVEAFGSIDMSTEGPLIATALGTMKLKAGSTFEVGSTNFSLNAASLEYTGLAKIASSLYANKVWAPQAELNFIKSNSGSSGATATTPTYSQHDPGDAAPASLAPFANLPAPPSPTSGPGPEDPAPAALTSRVPEHEPWFQHENFNPSGFANIRAGSETTDSFVPPVPDPFAIFAQQLPTTTTTAVTSPSTTPSTSTDEESEEPIVGAGRNYNLLTPNAQVVIDFFNSKFPGDDFKDWVGCGVAGALQWESGNEIPPGAYLSPNSRSDGLVNVTGNGGYGARGICQWRDAGGRLTAAERFLGKSLLQQPVTDPNTPGYERMLDDRRFPTTSFSSMPTTEKGTRIAPSNTTIEDQLNLLWHEMETTEIATKRAIEAVSSGSEVQRTRRVAEIMNDVFLRSGNPAITVSAGVRTPVKTLRGNHAVTLLRLLRAGQGTDPVDDPERLVPAAPAVGGGDPAANSRAPVQGDAAEETISGGARNIVEGNGGSSRRGPLNPSLISVLNRAARDTGITKIINSSGANECLRRINLDGVLPLDRWGTFPGRSDGPDADMRNRSSTGDAWQILDRATGTWQYRDGPRGSVSYRIGSERHDTGLAVDALLYATINGRETWLKPTIPAHRARIAEFLTAFARYGGRAVGVGGPSSRVMPDGTFHLDMLGAYFTDPAAIRPTGLRGTLIMGWNVNQISGWPYSGSDYEWAVAAMQRGFRG